MNAPNLSSLKIDLPTADAKLETFVLSEPCAYPDKAAAAFDRVAFAAAHVVADARAVADPWIDCALDWEQTLAYREYLWGLGLGVAEAMDTAQRGMGLDWPTSLELIRRSVAAAKAWEVREGRQALIFSGCGTDHLDPAAVRSVDEVIRAYEEQMAAVEAAGGRLIVMASRALARVAKSPADYERVYDRVLSQAREPVMIHWLGEMFDPALGRLLGRSITWPPWRRRSASSTRTPPRSTASRSRCSTRTRRSPCAAAWRRACACTPATTSTTPS